MPTTAKATTSEATTSNHHTQTVDGEAFSPVTDRIHHHGRDPEAPGPETLEGLAEDVQQTSVYLMEAAGILKTIAERHNDRAPQRQGVAYVLGHRWGRHAGQQAPQ